MSDHESPNKFQPSQNFVIPPESFKPHTEDSKTGGGCCPGCRCCSRSKCCVWFSQQTLKKKVGIVLGGVALLVGVVFGVRFFCIQHHFKKADEFAKNGFFALAEEQLDCHRRSYAKDERGCNLMISVYHQTQNKTRRQWASERCLQNGVQTLMAYLGVSAGLQDSGRAEEALRVLKEVKPRFEQNPAYHYEVYGIYRRAKLDKQAADALYRVYELAPDKKAVTTELLPLLQSVGDTVRFEKVKAEVGK